MGNMTQSARKVLFLVGILSLSLPLPIQAQSKTQTANPGVQETKTVIVPTSASVELVPLEIEYPKIYMSNYVYPDWSRPYLDKNSLEPRPPVLVPKDVSLLSKNKKVASSDKEPEIGELQYITDGDKDSCDGSFVELPHPGVQWIQIDLGEPCDIYVIVVWHFYLSGRIYHDIIIRCADAPDFKTGARTLFNNDYDNSAGFGIGKDLEYVEWHRGKLIDCKDRKGMPARARYVRCYSNGNSYNAMNQYVEVEVYGRSCAKGGR